MADIALRFHKDLLVLSAPAQTSEMALLIEPEIYDDIYALDVAVGVQCLVADTAMCTPARLAHARLEDAGAELARAALDAADSAAPQHVLVELAPCGLPLDVSSKASLLETRDQYVRAAGWFAPLEHQFDAYFLNGFETCAELKCALMGLRKVSDKPIFASVNVAGACAEDAEGSGAEGAATPMLAGGRDETLSDAVAIMAEYGAQVVGFKTDAAPSIASALALQAAAASGGLPMLVQFDVRNVDPAQERATDANPYFEAETMADAADLLAAAGVQFFRAVGAATPAYTGALVGATIGDPVNRPRVFSDSATTSAADPMSMVDALRERVNTAIAGN